MKKVIILFFILTLAILAKELKYENLLQGVPENYKLAFKNYNKQTHLRLLEFVPKNETVDDWSKMITTNIYHKNIDLTAEEYIQQIESLWKNNCQNGFTKILPNGKQNGYEYALLMAYCPKSKVTNKKENTYFKAIKGNDSFYVVQKAFAYQATKEEIIDAMKYLRRTFVCDTRLNNCPKGFK